MRKKLYLVSTKTLGDYYVVAESPNEAQDRLKKLIDKADYGFSDSRKIVNIKLLADELYNFPVNRPNFGKEPILILESSCETES